MGERLLCKQEVIGSIPFSSTKTEREDRDRRAEHARDPGLVGCEIRVWSSRKRGVRRAPLATSQGGAARCLTW